MQKVTYLLPEGLLFRCKAEIHNTPLSRSVRMLKGDCDASRRLDVRRCAAFRAGNFQSVAAADKCHEPTCRLHTVCGAERHRPSPPVDSERKIIADHKSRQQVGRDVGDDIAVTVYVEDFANYSIPNHSRRIERQGVQRFRPRSEFGRRHSTGEMRRHGAEDIPTMEG